VGAFRRCLSLSRDESGIVLILALVVMLVLTIALATALAISSSGSRNANRVDAGQKAYAIAESGINNAVAVLQANYPGTVAYPGNSALLPSRSNVVGSGSCVAPVNNCVTWSGTLAGPLVGPPWRYEWRITSMGTVQNPAAPGGTVARQVTAIVPVVLPPTEPGTPAGPLAFLYANHNMTFTSSVQVNSPVYVTNNLTLNNSVNILSPVYVGNDLTLSSTSTIAGAAQTVSVGHDLFLTQPSNQIGQVGAGDPALTAIHVVHQCSSKNDPALHDCGTAADPWTTDKIFAIAHDNVMPASPVSFVPTLTCCAPYGGSIAPAGVANPSNMGFLYTNASPGPLSPCTTSSLTGSATLPVFDTAGGTPDNSINNSATPTTPFNLTPSGGDYSCKTVLTDGSILGELSWNHTTKVLTVTGTIFIDGSATVDATGFSGNPAFRYTGFGTIVLAGTFGMQGSALCAVVTSNGKDCNVSAGAWNPNPPSGATLMILADGDGGGGGAQSQQGNLVSAGEGIHLKSAEFQGILVANKNITVETTATMQGPMISVYNDVLAGQTGTLSFPTIAFPPSGGGGTINNPPLPQLLTPQSFAGG
jgi:hypothetical protein